MNIEFHIDELILHGFRPAERAAIATAVERAMFTGPAQASAVRLKSSVSASRSMARSSAMRSG